MCLVKETREEPIIGRPVVGVARERDYHLMRSPPVCRTGGNHGVTVQCGCRPGYPQENCRGGSLTKRTAGNGITRAALSAQRSLGSRNWRLSYGSTGSLTLRWNRQLSIGDRCG